MDFEDEAAESFIEGRIEVKTQIKNTFEFVTVTNKIKRMPMVESVYRTTCGIFLVDFFEGGNFPEPMDFVQDLMIKIQGMI